MKNRPQTDPDLDIKPKYNKLKMSRGKMISICNK